MAQFDERATTRFLNRLTELQEIDKAKKDGDNTSVVAGMPLAYIIRDNNDIAPDNLACNDWGSVDDDLVVTSILEGETFLCDNKRVFDILKPFVMEGLGWPFVQPFNRRRDGCAAFKALKSQANKGGISAIATQKAKAYTKVTTAIFTGEGKFSFDQYVGKHQQAQNELLFLDEPVTETKKVTDFLTGICDPKLETAIQTCMGNEQKLTNFELCQQYFKTIVENTKTRIK